MACNLHFFLLLIEIIIIIIINVFFFLLCSKEDAKTSLLYSYKHGFSGFAARMTKSQAEDIASMNNLSLIFLYLF